MNPKVDLYLVKVEKWQEELTLLRKIMLDCGLTEEWKWKQPCYTFQHSNVLILFNLRDYCSISFFKGALLQNDQKMLSKPGANTRAARIVRFTDMQEIIARAPIWKPTSTKPSLWKKLV